MIRIESIDESVVLVKSDCYDIREKLSKYFSYRDERYDRKSRKKWYYTRSVYHKGTGSLPKGLLPYVAAYAHENKTPLCMAEYQGSGGYSSNDAGDYIHNLVISDENGEQITPFDYQISGTLAFLSKKRTLQLHPTGAGKSLISYMIVRACIDLLKLHQIVIIVPRIGLVEQLYKNFEEYSIINKWDVKSHVQCINKNHKEKQFVKPVIITTFQSLKDQHFENVDCMIGDEAHLFEAKTLIEKSGRFKNAGWRCGLTGTIKDAKSNKLILEGIFGPVVRIKSTMQLVDEKRLTPFEIQPVFLKYSNSARRDLRYKGSSGQRHFAINHPSRNIFFKKMIHKEGNTLILAKSIDHLKRMKDWFDVNVDHNVNIIYGDIDTDIRGNIKETLESSNKNILIASYGTFSTGENVKNIHRIILGSDVSSKITVLQSIGRGLRLHNSKNKILIFDVVDDMRFSEKCEYSSHSIDRYNERCKFYNNEGFIIRDLISFEI